ADVETMLRLKTACPTSTLQWCHVLADVETPWRRPIANRSYPSFNGATSSRTWKQWSTLFSFPGTNTLQWCHVLADVETRPPAPPGDRRRPGFNGATSSRTWKHVYVSNVKARYYVALQWCHVLAD